MYVYYLQYLEYECMSSVRIICYMWLYHYLNLANELLSVFFKYRPTPIQEHYSLCFHTQFKSPLPEGVSQCL